MPSCPPFFHALLQYVPFLHLLYVQYFNIYFHKITYKQNFFVGIIFFVTNLYYYFGGVVVDRFRLIIDQHHLNDERTNERTKEDKNARFFLLVYSNYCLWNKHGVYGIYFSPLFRFFRTFVQCYSPIHQKVHCIVEVEVEVETSPRWSEIEIESTSPFDTKHTHTHTHTLSLSLLV